MKLIRIKNEIGLLQSAPAGEEQFARLGCWSENGPAPEADVLLFVGLGPEPEAAARLAGARAGKQAAEGPETWADEPGSPMSAPCPPRRPPQIFAQTSGPTSARTPDRASCQISGRMPGRASAQAQERNSEPMPEQKNSGAAGGLLPPLQDMKGRPSDRLTVRQTAPLKAKSRRSPCGQGACPPAPLPVCYCEAPAFAAQMPPEWTAQISPGWRKLEPMPRSDAGRAEAEPGGCDPDSEPPDLLSGQMQEAAGQLPVCAQPEAEMAPEEKNVLARILSGRPAIALYRPGLRLFPSFYGPRFAQIQTSLLGLPACDGGCEANATPLTPESGEDIQADPPPGHVRALPPPFQGPAADAQGHEAAGMLAPLKKDKSSPPPACPEKRWKTEEAKFFEAGDTIKLSASPPRPAAVVLAASERGLLTRELEWAFQSLGHRVLRVEPEQALAALPQILRSCRPSLFVGVNLAGFDPFGELFYLLEALGVPAAAWCVDNPWHLLSALRSPFWKKLHLFVTDASFLPGLHRAGCTRARHLPLAALPGLFDGPDCRAAARPAEIFQTATQPEPLPGRMPLSPPAGAQGRTPPQAVPLFLSPAPSSFKFREEDEATEQAAFSPAALAAQTENRPWDMVFAGRSQFPGRDRFFAAARLDPALLEAAGRDTLAGQPRHFAWWCAQLGLNALWPGQQVRQAGLGAENCSLLWRGAAVQAALQSGLAFQAFGNAEWLEQVPALARHLSDPVDYYTALPRIYAEARMVLSSTSLLLPAGLNQRHFDAWMAGAVCLSDNTPGLDIFPTELTAPIIWRKPEDIPALARSLKAAPALCAELVCRWRSLILHEHTYLHRINEMLKAVGI